MVFRFLCVVATIAFTIAACGTTDAGDWSQFRGANCLGQGKQQPTVPSEFGPQKNILWKCPVTRGLSSPCIVGNRIFLTAFDSGRKQLSVICIGRDEGNIIWQKGVAAKVIEKVHRISSPANATPVADSQRVCVYFGSCGLFCFDHDGNQLWHHAINCSRRFNGSGTSPILVGDRVILNREDDRERYLLVLNAGTGEQIWKTSHPGSGSFGEATPLIRNDQIILHRHNEAAGYALSDGKRLWSIPLSTTAASTPVIHGDILYVAAWNNFGESDLKGELPPFAQLLTQADRDRDGEISRSEMPWGPALARRPELAGRSLGANMPVKFMFGALDANRNGKISEAEWQAAPAVLDKMVKGAEHGLTAIQLPEKDDQTEPTIKWTINKSVPEVPSPLIVGPHLYMVKNGGILTCIDRQTGDIVYRRRLNTAGPYLSSPIAVNDFIITASSDGIVTVFRAGEDYERLSSVDMKEPIMATPAVADGVLYLRTDMALYAFREPQ